MLQFIRHILKEFVDTSLDENEDRAKSKLFSVLEKQREIDEGTLSPRMKHMICNSVFTKVAIKKK